MCTALRTSVFQGHPPPCQRSESVIAATRCGDELQDFSVKADPPWTTPHQQEFGIYDQMLAIEQREVIQDSASVDWRA